MINKIKDWLEKNGYPLELFVSRIFQIRKYYSNPSCLYVDVDSGIHREIDSVATREVNGPNYTVAMDVIVECKKSKYPYVILIDNNKPAKRFEHLFGIKPIGDDLSNVGFSEAKAFFYLHQFTGPLKSKIGAFAECVNSGYSIVQALCNSDTNIYKGIIGLLKAKEYFDKEHTKLNDEYKELNRQYYKLSIPVLIVDGSLVETQLDELGELHVKEIDWGTVTIKKPWASGPEDMVNIQVVKKEYFNEFLEALEKLHDLISSEDAVQTLEFIESKGPTP
jgi:hypothetical protein